MQPALEHFEQKPEKQERYEPWEKILARRASWNAFFRREERKESSYRELKSSDVVKNKKDSYH